MITKQTLFKTLNSDHFFIGLLFGIMISAFTMSAGIVFLDDIMSNIIENVLNEWDSVQFAIAYAEIEEQKYIVPGFSKVVYHPGDSIEIIVVSNLDLLFYVITHDDDTIIERGIITPINEIGVVKGIFISPIEPLLGNYTLTVSNGLYKTVSTVLVELEDKPKEIPEPVNVRVVQYNDNYYMTPSKKIVIEPFGAVNFIDAVTIDGVIHEGITELEPGTYNIFKENKRIGIIKFL